MKRLSYLFPSIITLFLLNSCQDTPSDNCLENQICTEEFRSVVVEITDASGNPVSLDSVSTFFATTGERISSIERFDIHTPGIYSVLTDAEKDIVYKEGTAFIFKGWITSEVVLDEEFLIGHDCCHVILLDGPTEIQLP